MLQRIARWTWLMFGYLGAATFLFVLANVIATRYINPMVGSSDTVFHRILGPESSEGIPVLKKIFGSTSDEEALSRNRMAPNFEMHPDLHYMTARVSNAHYRIGLEGVRYDAGWNDDEVKKLLAAPRGVFLFGGSTMMGHGVSGNETISWYLNQLNDKNNAPALNFGSEAYDFQRAAEKLAYLLRVGYRPKNVVFLIGWNEINLSARSNMRWQDKVVFHGFSANRGEVAYTPNGATQLNYRKLLADSLPIIQYLRNKQIGGCPININPERDPFVDGFDFREAYCQFNDWEDFAQAHGDLLREQVRLSLKAHIDFIEGLSKAFGFGVTIVFQPMGLFDSQNLFVPARARESKGYKYLEMLQNDIRHEIGAGKLRMIDGSDWLEELKVDRYVDVAHYSPGANRLLAHKLNALIKLHP